MRDVPLDIRHVVMVESGSPPSRANGVHRVATALAAEQIEAGDKAQIFFLAEASDHASIDAGGVPSAILPLGRRGILGRPARLGRGAAAAMVAGTDARTIYHLHGGRFPIWINVVRLLHKHGLPYTITVHGRYAHGFDVRQRIVRPRTAIYIRLFERGILESAKFVHAISGLERDCLRRIAPKARVELVPNGSYSSALEARPVMPVRQMSPHYPTFGFCGRLAIRHKGLDLLLEGFSLYRRRGGRGRLVIAGPGNAGSELAMLAARLGVADEVEIRGAAFGAEKAELMRSWDFFIMPSRFEGGPTAALEAALAGFSLIVSEETGIKEALAAYGAGTTLDALSPHHIAEAFLEAEGMKPDVWERMSESAHRMGVAIGDWSTAARLLRDLYVMP